MGDHDLPVSSRPLDPQTIFLRLSTFPFSVAIFSYIPAEYLSFSMLFDKIYRFSSSTIARHLCCLLHSRWHSPSCMHSRLCQRALPPRNRFIGHGRYRKFHIPPLAHGFPCSCE